MVLFPHKKGSLTVIVTIITILLAFGVLVALTPVMFSAGEKATEHSECKAALGVQKVLDNVPYFSYNNACKTLVVNIPESKKGIKENKQVSDLIAKKMMRVWDTVHLGTIPNMWSEDKDWVLFMEESSCLVLYDINLKYVPEEGYTQKQLYDYIKETPYKRVDGVTRTFLGYVQFAGGHGTIVFPEQFKVVKTKGGNEKLKPKSQSPELKENSQYSISIVSPKKDVFAEELNLGKQDNTFLAFSSTNFAETEMGCKRT